MRNKKITILLISMLVISITFILIGVSIEYNGKNTEKIVTNNYTETVVSEEEKEIRYQADFVELNNKCVELYNAQQYQSIINAISDYKNNHPNHEEYLKRYQNWLIDDYESSSINIPAIIDIRTAIDSESAKLKILSLDSWCIYPITSSFEEQEPWYQFSQNLVNEFFGNQQTYNMHYSVNKQRNAPEPSIGMTRMQVRQSKWGEPTKINKTSTKYADREQWVYNGNKLIYFENGIVTSISEY